jgi:hypothetical protein
MKIWEHTFINQIWMLALVQKNECGYFSTLLTGKFKITHPRFQKFTAIYIETARPKSWLRNVNFPDRLTPITVKNMSSYYSGTPPYGYHVNIVNSSLPPLIFVPGETPRQYNIL